MLRLSLLLSTFIISVGALWPTPSFSAGTGIQMLPPIQSGTTDTVCNEVDVLNNASEGNKLLTWDGITSIKCNKNFVITPAGKIGLGVNPPLYTLDIRNPTGPVSARLSGKPFKLGGTDHLGEILLGHNLNNGKLWILAARGPSDDESPNGLTIAHFTNVLGNNDYSNPANWRGGINIDQTGNIGLGAISTGAKLHVFGDATVSGNLGVGTSVPASKLDIAGGVKIGSDVAACTAAKAGTVRWTGTAMEYCNGSAWAPFGGSPDCQVYQADTAGILTGGTKVVHSFEMVTFTCPANRPQMTSGSCWRKNSGTFIGTHNMEDGRSYRCRIEGGGGLDIWATCCK